MARRILPFLGAAALTLVLFELGAAALMKSGTLPGSLPPAEPAPYWWEDHPDFGVWRRPYAEATHQTRCFRARYQTNAAGMRDVDRPLDAAQPRVVVLGDSHLAGWGLPAGLRLSNQLERMTGVPHLNFAMPHFGPYQQLLVYEQLARRYEHDAVIASLLPINDFRDIDLELASRLVGYEHVYRPYLIEREVGDTRSYEHLSHRESRLRRWLRKHSHLFNAVAASRPRGGVEGILSWTPEEKARASEVTRRAPSWFYDFQDRHIRLLEVILRRLAASAQGKPVTLFLVPSRSDFQRREISGPDPLEPALQEVAEATGIQIVNFLSVLSQRGSDWERYFFDCDYHWNAYANQVAAEHLIEALGSEHTSLPSK